MNPNEGRKPEQFDNCLRYWVWSRTRRGQKYLVELSGYNLSGRCDCMDFQTRIEPLLRRGITPAQAIKDNKIRLKDGLPNHALMCKHIVMARDHLCTSVIEAINKTLHK